MSRALIILIASAAAFRGEAADVGANRRPPKCCPIGQVLNSFGRDCKFMKSDQLIVPVDVENSYPNCSREHIQEIDAKEGNLIMCLDKMLGNDNTVRDSARLIGLTCKNSNSYSDVYDVPRVISVKKCCPIERKYDNYTNGCWSKNIANDNNTIEKLLQSLLNNTNIPSYIDITYGAPICKSDEVLVDYFIPKYQVLLMESEAIKMRIPGHSEYIILPPESICVDIHSHDDLTIIVRACQDETLICRRQQKTCIRKCCPDGQSMFYNNTCVKSKSIFNPKFYSDVDTSHVKLLSDNVVYPSLVYGRKCENIYLLEPWTYQEDVCYLDKKGELYSPFLNKYYDRDSYCLEYLSSIQYNVSKLVAFACFPEIYEHMSNYTSTFFFVAGSGSIVSSFFLTLTLIVYSCLPNLQNIHGKTMMCYIFCLIFAYLWLSINQIGGMLFDFVTDEHQCRALGYATMFSFLAAFSWLNVLCFDIWYTFGSVRSTFERRKTNTRSRRFLYYNLYSWGFAGTVTSITVGTDYAAKLGYLTHVWVSDIGITTCWFSKMTKGIILYFVMPVGIQMIINLFFFILTTQHYLRVKCAIAKMHNNTGAKQRYHTDKKKFTMAFKLFIMMGITWIPEMLSHIIDPASGWWLFTDLLNVMHGLLIFLLLVFKRTIVKGLAKRMREILPCCNKNKTAPKPTRSNSSTVFTTISSECKLSSVRQK